MGDDYCPDLIDHTAQPSGYLAWHEWAAEMSKTHRQRKCGGCNLYAIWEPRGAPLARLTTHPTKETR